MARATCVFAVFAVASAVVQANQCSTGGECPGSEEPNHVLSLLQMKLQMKALRDGGEAMSWVELGKGRCTSNGDDAYSLVNAYYDFGFVGGLGACQSECISHGGCLGLHYYAPGHAASGEHCVVFTTRVAAPTGWQLDAGGDNTRQIDGHDFSAAGSCWLLEQDPSGHHLTIIKHALRLRLSCKGQSQIKDIALVFDFMSLPQNSETGGDEPQFLQHRCAEDEVAFKAGISDVNVLYAHQMTEVWLLEWVPAGRERTYSERAWPQFEKMASSMIKDSNKLVTLDHRITMLSSWTDVFETRPRRLAPLTPTAFNILIETKSVTSGKDIDFLKNKYEETFSDVVGGAENLWFADLDWQDEEAACLDKLVPSCKRLQTLIVSGNNFSAQAALGLIRAFASSKCFLALDLKDNQISDQEQHELMAAWKFAGKCEIYLALGSMHVGEACVKVLMHF